MEVRSETALGTPVDGFGFLVGLCAGRVDIVEVVVIVDISYWQGLPYSESPDDSGVDYDLLAAKVLATPELKQRGVVLRATSGTAVDLRFEQHYAELSARGVPLASYHNFKPAVDIADQGEMYQQTIAGKEWDFWMFERALDVETPYPFWSQPIYATKTYEMMLAGNFDCVYSSNYFWGLLIGLHAANWVNQYRRWVAHYTNAPQPLLPITWSGYDMWQYSADGNGQGPDYGVRSSAIDLNKVNPAAVDPPPVPIPGAGTFQMRAISAVNVREQPAASGSIYDTIQAGELVNVLDVAVESRSPVRIWVQISKAPERWCALMYQYHKLGTIYQFMERL